MLVVASDATLRCLLNHRELVMNRHIEISIYRFRYRYIVSYRIVKKDIDFFDISRYFKNIGIL